MNSEQQFSDTVQDDFQDSYFLQRAHEERVQQLLADNGHLRGAPHRDTEYPWQSPRRIRHVTWPEVALCEGIAQDPRSQVFLSVAELAPVLQDLMAQARLTQQERHVIMAQSREESTQDTATILNLHPRTILRRLQSAQIKLQDAARRNHITLEDLSR